MSPEAKSREDSREDSTVAPESKKLRSTPRNLGVLPPVARSALGNNWRGLSAVVVALVEVLSPPLRVVVGLAGGGNLPLPFLLLPLVEGCVSTATTMRALTSAFEHFSRAPSISPRSIPQPVMAVLKPPCAMGHSPIGCLSACPPMRSTFWFWERSPASTLLRRLHEVLDLFQGVEEGGVDRIELRGRPANHMSPDAAKFKHYPPRSVESSFTSQV